MVFKDISKESDKREIKLINSNNRVREDFHICPICKTEFEGRPNKIYCSPRCKRKAKKIHKRERIYKFFLKNNPGFGGLPEMEAGKGSTLEGVGAF